ncbi:MAG: zeta toxin family protein [Bacteroidales bacterium]|jgi:predicted ABC-type ATPase|nr:zeta toxin family protein [Bacteroidales bacterium]
MPRLFIIAGCNGSGKTTASYSVLPEMLECTQFVNSDEFAKSIAPFDPDSASVSAGRFMLMRINYLFNKKEDFCIESTLATRSLLRMVREAKSNGYTVTIIYLWLNSSDLAIARVHDRVLSGGHNIPEPIIRRRFFMGLKYFFDEYIPECDRWILADNSKTPFTVIAEGSHDLVHIKDSDKYDLTWALAHPPQEAEQE